MVQDFFQNGVMPNGLNIMNIVLLPDKKSPSTVGDLRPISLCNVLVKIITIILANRMKNIMDGVVAESQSTFIPGGNHRQNYGGLKDDSLFETEM